MVQLVKYGNCSIRVAFKSSCITSCLWWLLPCDPSVMLYCRCDVLFLMWWMLCQQCGRRSSSTCFLEPVWCTRCWSNRTGELLVWRVSHWCHRINPSITLWPSQSELCRVVRTAGDVEDGAGSQAHQCKWRLIGSFNLLLWYYGIYLFWCVNVASILIIIELQGFISGNMLDCDWFSTFSVWKFAFLKTANLCVSS